MKDEEHAFRIREIERALGSAIGAAAADGLNIEIKVTRQPYTVRNRIWNRVVETAAIGISRPLSGSPLNEDPF